MKYEAMIRSIPTRSISETHGLLLSAMNSVEKPWGFAGEGGPAPPDPGRELLAEVKLQKYLGPGVRGEVVYRYRGGLGSAAMYDDFLTIEFNPDKQDYSRFVNNILPDYIVAFNGYSAHVGDTQFNIIDFDANRKVDLRHGVYRIYPVSYFGKDLCHEAFNRSPEEILRLWSGDCERCAILNQGVLVIVTSKPLALAEADQINNRLRDRLVRG